MKENQRVYIKGNSKRCKEVIKTLKDLGGSNPNHYRGEDDNAYYYINPDGEIAYACADGSVAYPFLREFYKEIKPPRWKPKYKERYYRISWEGSVVDDTWTDTQDEEICYEFGNCFRTPEEAREASRKIEEMLNNRA
jgi:hypothetical protein